MKRARKVTLAVMILLVLPQVGAARDDDRAEPETVPDMVIDHPLRQRNVGAETAPAGAAAPARTRSGEPNAAGPTGEELFLACSGCHSLDPANIDLVGPHLVGIVGREVAALEDYPYSQELATAPLVWERNVLFSWIVATEGLVPGTRMLYHNHLKPEEVFRLIDFLQGSTRPEAAER